MNSDRLPKGVQFKTVKPQGFYQEFRDYVVTPVQTYQSVFSVNDIVRIQFNLQDWYIDPYESYIEAQVGLQNETAVDFASAFKYDGSNPVQFLMMDGPSTSLINDFRLEVNSKEIERVREYDQVGQLLTDLNMYPDSVDQKDYEGYYSIKGRDTLMPLQASQESCVGSGSGVQISQSMQGFNVPVFGSKQVLYTDTFGEPVINNGNAYPFTPLAQSSTTAGDLNLNSLASLKYDNMPYGYTGAKANTSMMSFLASAADAKIGGGTLGQIYNPSQYLGQMTVGNSNFGINSDYPSAFGVNSSRGNAGYLYCPNSPKMEQIDGHNIFLTNLPTSKIIAGKFQGSMYSSAGLNAQSQAYMQIPLLSGVMGVLIPPERWQLIPSSSLGNVNMEFRFNPFAFISHNGDTPNWMVRKFQLKLRLYRFDSALQAQLKQQVSQGIQLHSQVMSMGPMYSIQPNTSVTNTWQINNGIPSIRHLFFWFLSNDYEQYAYARKNFRLSHNINSAQLKISSNYIPISPLTGHAGQIIVNSQIPYDNSVYLSELHSSLNLLFDCQKHININKVNFAINQRPYDVSMNTALGLSSTELTNKKKFMLLEGGFPLWNEMRCRGKAVYSINLDMDKKNDDTMTGIDTTKVRPIELILRSDDPNVYTGSSTMYTMFLCDFIVSFGASDTQTEGAG